MTTDSSGTRKEAAGRETGVGAVVGARAGRGSGARGMGVLPSLGRRCSGLGGEYSSAGAIGASPIDRGVSLAGGGAVGQNETHRPLAEGAIMDHPKSVAELCAEHALDPKQLAERAGLDER